VANATKHIAPADNVELRRQDALEIDQCACDVKGRIKTVFTTRILILHGLVLYSETRRTGEQQEHQMKMELLKTSRLQTMIRTSLTLNQATSPELAST
jgi:hypothetical protein